MRFILVLVISLLLFHVPCIAQASKGSVASRSQLERLSDSEKTEIILSVLNRRARGERNFRKSSKSDRAYISTENLPKSLPKRHPKIRGVRVEYVSPDGLEEKARDKFDYIEFSEFRFEGRNVSISISHSFASGGDSTLVYEFRKIKGRWLGKLVGSSWSVSD